MIVLQERDRAPGDTEGAFNAFACPNMPIYQAIGILGIGKVVFSEHACGRSLDRDG